LGVNKDTITNNALVSALSLVRKLI